MTHDLLPSTPAEKREARNEALDELTAQKLAEKATMRQTLIDRATAASAERADEERARLRAEERTAFFAVTIPEKMAAIKADFSRALAGCIELRTLRSANGRYTLDAFQASSAPAKALAEISREMKWPELDGWLANVANSILHHRQR